MAEYFWKDLLIGLVFGVPAGAIGALTIGRTLEKGFAAFGIHGGLSVEQGAVLIVGILIGTLCWWLILSGITAYFRDRITGKIYRWLNGILGCIMTGFGIAMIIQGD